MIAFLAVCCFLGGMALACFATFKIGYSLGWEERHKEMILPRNILKRVNHDLDDRETHHRHSGVWK